MSFYVLCALMFSVGFSIGHQPDTVSQFKSLPLRILFLPFTTIVGTLLGVLTLIGEAKAAEAPKPEAANNAEKAKALMKRWVLPCRD